MLGFDPLDVHRIEHTASTMIYRFIFHDGSTRSVSREQIDKLNF